MLENNRTILFIFAKITPLPPKGGVSVQKCSLCCGKAPFRGLGVEKQIIN